MPFLPIIDPNNLLLDTPNENRMSSASGWSATNQSCFKRWTKPAVSFVSKPFCMQPWHYALARLTTKLNRRLCNFLVIFAGTLVSSRNHLVGRFWLSTTAVWCTRRSHTHHMERASISRAAAFCAGQYLSAVKNKRMVGGCVLLSRFVYSEFRLNSMSTTLTVTQ